MSSPQTTHSDKVAGWSIIGLFVLGVVAVVVGAYAPHLSAAGQTALFVIAGSCGSAVAGSLVPRPSTPPAPPVDPPSPLT
jgi:hypothetical protein